MFKYLNKVVEEFPEDVGRNTYKTQVAAHLFQVQGSEDRKLVLEE